MSTIFLYEDGHENAADEHEFVVETLTTHSEYMQTVSSSELL